MSFRSPHVPRTVVAAALLAGAVVIPCAAWFVTGSRSVDREAADLVAAPAARAATTAARLAGRTRERLRAIVRVETRRPFYQYRHSYPDLTENCECASVRGAEEPAANPEPDRAGHRARGVEGRSATATGVRQRGRSAGALLAAVFVVGLVRQSERLARQRSRFAASAAHELRTPLAGMRVYGEMLAHGLGDPKAGRQYARQIATEAERLGRVVSNVLGTTRLERGALVVKPEPADIGALTREAAERMRAALESAGALLVVDVPGDLPRTPVDRDALFQILQNLVDNAERYSRASDDRTVRVSARRAGGAVEVSVADRGPGIPARIRRRLFRPFARGEEANAPAGLGLGLAMVAGLARAHGGDVRHEERGGGGSRFVVTLPD